MNSTLSWLREWVLEPSCLSFILGSAILLTLLSYLVFVCVSVSLSGKWTSNRVCLIKSVHRLNVLMYISYKVQDQELSRYSVSVSYYYPYRYYYFTKIEGTKPHCTLLNILWGSQMNVGYSHCPKWMCNPKWEIMLYKYLLYKSASNAQQGRRAHMHWPHTYCELIWFDMEARVGN